MTTEHIESSPLVRIRSLLPGLARAEQRVAKVVLDNPSTVARRSITEVADAAGTSETTVTRFCKAIGVGGWRSGVRRTGVCPRRSRLVGEVRHTHVVVQDQRFTEEDMSAAQIAALAMGEQ